MDMSQFVQEQHQQQLISTQPTSTQTSQISTQVSQLRDEEEDDDMEGSSSPLGTQDPAVLKLPRATLEQKIRALDWFKRNGTKSQRYTVRYFQSLNEFAIAKSSFNRWVKEEAQLRSDYAKLTDWNRNFVKTRPSVKYPFVDLCLAKYYEQHIFEDEPISGKELMSKWYYFAKILYPNSPTDSEKKSNGWLQHFKTRNANKVELINKHFNELWRVKKSNLTTFDERHRLKLIIKRYNPSDVFQFDEFSVTSRILPTDHAKVKLVVGVGMNSNVTEFLPLLIVSNTSTGVIDDENYFQSNTNQLTNEIFYNYLLNWDKKIEINQPTRKILLLLDKLYEHVIPPLRHIDIQWFDGKFHTFYSRVDYNNIENTGIRKTYDVEIQPLNLGIIKNLKLEFKTTLYQHHLNHLQLYNELKNINFELMYELIQDSYTKIQSIEYIKYLNKCWEISGILPWPDFIKSKVNDYDSYNVVFNTFTELKFWKLLKIFHNKGILKKIDPTKDSNGTSNLGYINLSMDQILFPEDENVLNRHLSDHEIIALIKLQSKESTFTKNSTLSSIIEPPSDSTDNNTLINKDLLNQMNGLLNFQMNKFLKDNSNRFPRSYKNFQKFLNYYIQESMDIYLEDEPIEQQLNQAHRVNHNDQNVNDEVDSNILPSLLHKQ